MDRFVDTFPDITTTIDDYFGSLRVAYLSSRSQKMVTANRQWSIMEVAKQLLFMLYYII